MYTTRAQLLFLAALVAGCGRDKQGSTNRLGSGGRGSELEAPRLIPAMRNQLGLMSNDSEPVNTENLTAYKNLAGDLINSMAIDLNRVGYADSGSYKALSDSVRDDLEGQAGSGANLDRSKLDQHTARMERLISLYQAAMRNGRDRL